MGSPSKRKQLRNNSIVIYHVFEICRICLSSLKPSLHLFNVELNVDAKWRENVDVNIELNIESVNSRVERLKLRNNVDFNIARNHSC